MEKQYDLLGHNVIVQFEPKLIRIQGSKQLLAFLRTDLNANTLKFVKSIKADYLMLIGKPLKVTNASLMVEIWGHLYASKFAIAVNELIKLSIIQNITEKVTKRSDTIDCGEADLDSNRRFWDVLAKFKSTIIRFL
jgi:hypothetical protein